MKTSNIKKFYKDGVDVSKFSASEIANDIISDRFMIGGMLMKDDVTEEVWEFIVDRSITNDYMIDLWEGNKLVAFEFIKQNYGER